MGEKYCNKCKETKPLIGFGRNRSRKEGLQYYCRRCSYEFSRGWRRAGGKNYHLSPIERYRQIVKRGKVRGVRLLISLEDFVSWMNAQSKTCHYCGCRLEEIGAGNMKGLTLERLDNERHYELDNIALACRRCNTMKGSWLTEAQMIDAAQRYFTTK